MHKEHNFLTKESCFGYHADVHLWENDLDAGSRALPDELEESLRLVNPDWVQVDSKGHAGFCSWFSKVPEASVAPHLAHDAVAAWREATRRLGLPLVCHHSGFLDLAAARRHPEWLVGLPPGVKREDPLGIWGAVMCPRSDYWTQLLVPQLLELAGDYAVDGIWTDGDLWSFSGCWCPKCRAEFTRRTGIEEVPSAPGQPHWEEWWQFQYDSVVETITRYVGAVHEKFPQVKVCSNWLDSIRYPVDGTVASDWLSGDTWPLWCQDPTTRPEVRWISNRRKDWDLMSWPDLGNPNYHIKSYDMLCQEAAPVIAAGGRYIFCETVGGVRSSQQVNWRLKRFGRIGDFIRARAGFCRGAEPLPEVAVLRSKRCAKLNCLNSAVEVAKDAVLALLDNQYHVDLVDEWALEGRCGEYKVIVVPEIGGLDPETVGALKKFVADGGRLLAVGVDAMKNFGLDFFGIRELEIEKVSPLAGRQWSFEYRKDETPLYFVSDETDGVFPVSSREWGLVRKVGDGAVGLEKLYSSYVREESEVGCPAAVVAACGAGWAAAIPADFFTAYRKHYFLPECRKFIGRVMKRLYPEREIGVSAPTVMDVIFRRKDGMRLIHLLNRSTGSATSPERKMIDEIPPVGPVELRIRCRNIPAAVSLLPGNEELPVRWTADGQGQGGTAVVVVPSVRIHCAVAVKDA